MSKQAPESRKDKNPARKTPERRTPETKLLTPKECEAIVAKYAAEKNVDTVTAECMLIATAWRRLEALRRYSEDMTAKAIADEKAKASATKKAAPVQSATKPPIKAPPKPAPVKGTKTPAVAPQKAPKVTPAPTAPKSNAQPAKKPLPAVYTDFDGTLQAVPELKKPAKKPAKKAKASKR
jgi:hypothetical protein